MNESSQVRRSAEILVIENDARIAELVKWFLERRGHRVRIVSSFGAARAAILARRPDLVLSDVDLGDESADVGLPVLAAEGLLPPTLVVSGLVEPELVARMEAIPGVVGVLAKPFEFPRLERWIDALTWREGASAESGGRP